MSRVSSKRFSNRDLTRRNRGFTRNRLSRNSIVVFARKTRVTGLIDETVSMVCFFTSWMVKAIHVFTCVVCERFHSNACEVRARDSAPQGCFRNLVASRSFERLKSVSRLQIYRECGKVNLYDSISSAEMLAEYFKRIAND